MGLRRAGTGSGSSVTVGSDEWIPRLQPRPSVPTGSGQPGRGFPTGGGLAPRRGLLKQPPPRLPLLPRPRLPGLAPTACPPVSAGPVGLSARQSVCCPGPASSSARVDSSVPATTNLSPDSALPASAT